jgi:hypothetical protein
MSARFSKEPRGWRPVRPPLRDDPDRCRLRRRGLMSSKPLVQDVDIAFSVC